MVTMSLTLGSLQYRANKLSYVKKIINTILENGAYSTINQQRQDIKADNYNDKEKIIVDLAWKFRRFESERLQNDFLLFLEKNQDFLKEVSVKEPVLYSKFTALLKKLKEVNK